MADAFPLSWPAGYPRTLSPRRARFGTSFTEARDGIFHELKLMWATGVVLSTNIELNRNGVPYAGRAQPRDPGVAVYFVRNGKRLVLACDTWARVEDNLQAVRLSLAAMRGLDRWGCSDILDRAFTGFTALPEPPKERSWAEVLGVDPSWPLHMIEQVYRNTAVQKHPDRGGSAEAMTELNRAIEMARTAKGGAA